ncbi:MAG TPA: Gfo/Idh/MocA family oxidoreductase [Bacteroidota bacterium]|nr:Gfo/Idh/MocA family oxidoreductase [Bacteroidota bacterium]
MRNHAGTSRRDFLRKASAAAAGAIGLPLFIPSRALGRAGFVAPSDRIAIACIGVGGMGTSNMLSFLGKPEARIVAVCDVDARHLREAAALVESRSGRRGVASYRDFREVLARRDLDAVSIATPDHWHALIATRAAAEGLDIYGEKPLGYTIAEGRAIVDAVARYNIIWQTGSWQRSVRNFRYACELVRNGRIGKVHTIRVGLPSGYSVADQGGFRIAPVPEGFDYDMWLGPAPRVPYVPNRCHWNFRWISDYSGGQLTDWAGHHCDIAQWAMDTEMSSPVEIEGTAHFPSARDGLFDTATSYRFVCTYREGFTMIVADRNQQPKGMGVQFEGTDGWIWVDREGFDASPRNLLSSAIGPDEIRLYRSDDHHQNFLDCVRSRRETLTPARVAHRSIMIGHLGLIAMKLGRKVTWNPDTERFVNDGEADRFLSRPMRSPWHL